MIIVRLLSPERSWLVGSHQSLLGYRSRHCHGINFTNYGSMSPHAVIRDLQSPTPQRPRPARVPALNNARPHTGPEVGSARELLRPSIHPSHVARLLGDCTDLHSRTWDQTRRSGSDPTALVCARLRHQRSQQHQSLAGSVAFFDIILVRH